METQRINGTLFVKTPVHHGGDEKTGVECGFRRMKYITGDNKVEEIPFIEGNAIRGMLRRLIMKDFVDSVGYKIKHPRLYHMLFSGGILEDVDTKDAGRLDVVARKKIRKFLIPISVLGSSYGNQAFSGKLNVGKGLIICKELNDFLPYKSNISFYEFIDWNFCTRRDDLREHRAKNQGAIQMKYNYEVLVPGTKLYHWFVLNDMNEVEKSCFGRMIELWKNKPFVGGRSAIGNGELSLNYDNVPSSEAYVDFILNNIEEIGALLDEFDTA